MRHDGSFVKVERLSQIKKEIAKQFPNPVVLADISLWVELNIGLSEEKTKEYIEKVVAGAGWTINDGKILAESVS